jgi:RHS repeat-associated protein
MLISLHKNATTTPAIRRAIQTSSASTAELARQYGLALDTVRKWRRRESVEDGSHTPHRLQTTLNEGQEELVVYLRTTLRLSLDDLLSVVREFIEPKMSRAALDRLLRRRGISRLGDLEPPEEKAPPKGFKDYEPGFVHIDVKYLPQMQDEDQRRYAFVAIDRATRWVYVRLMGDKSARSATAFLKSLHTAAPFRVRTILTDNGKEFTDRLFASRERQPSGDHSFDQLCQALGIEHRLTPVRRPQTNGMVERFNGRIAQVLRTRHFQSRDDLEQTLKRYVWLYNHQLIQKALNHESPIQAMKRWQQSHPNLFEREVRNHPGPNNYLDVPSLTCDPPSGTISEPVVWQMTHPSGAVGTFLLEPRRHGRQNIPNGYCGSTGINIGPNIMRAYWNFSLSEKSITGPSLPPSTWLFSFDGSSGKTAVVTNPDSSQLHRTFGTQFYLDEGKLLKERIYGSDSVLMKEVNYSYAVNPTSPPYAYRMGSYGMEFYGEDAFDSIFQYPVVNESVWVDDVTYTNGTDLQDFDAFARPMVSEASNTLGFYKRADLAYHHNYDVWVLGQIGSRTDFSTGLVEESVEYDVQTAQPLRFYQFGLLRYGASYNSDGTVSAVKDGLDRETSFSSWKRGLSQQIDFFDASSTTSIVNDRGWVMSIEDENSNVTTHEYDSMGRLSGIGYPSGDTVAWEGRLIDYLQLPMTEMGLPIGTWRREETVGSYRKRNYYDARLQVVLEEERDTAGGMPIYRRYEYDHEGRVVFESYPHASPAISARGVYIQYDALGRLVQRWTDEDIVLETIEYLSGNRKRITDADGKVTTITYQALGEPNQSRPILIESPEGQITAINRDIFGKITAVTQSGSWDGGVLSATRGFIYDDHQRLCRRNDPESGGTVWGHNAASEIIWEAKGQSGSGCLTSAPSGATLFAYDLRGRKVLDDYPGTGEDVSYAYDAAGNLISVSNATATWSYTYNKRNLLETEQAVLDGKTFMLDPNYNDLGHITSLTTPGQTIAYVPDAWGRPTQFGGYASGISYHPNGLPSDYNLGNGLSYSQTLNARQWPQHQQTVDGSSAIQSLQYGYTPAGNLTAITDMVDGSDNVTLTYDDLHRIETATGIWGTYTYAYDPLNNLRSRTHGGGTASLSYSYNAASNHLTAIGGSQSRSYAYNTRGEITGDGSQVFTLNNLGQIQSITGIATYGYDGNGRRIRTVKDGTTEYTLYDRSGQLVYREKGSTQTDYLSLNGRTIVELEKVGSTTTPTYLHPDLLGSPRKATSTSGTILWQEHYDPYGQKLNGTSSRIGYTGHVHDEESGYTYMQARFYDPLVGRFLSTDSVHFIDNNPFTFNRYAYANNNPYKYTDPNGEFAFMVPIGGALIGMGASVAVQLAANNYQLSAVSWTQVGISAAAGALGGGGAIVASSAQTARGAVGAMATAGGGIGAVSEVASNTAAGKSSTTAGVVRATLTNSVLSFAGARITNAARSARESATGTERVAAGNLREAFKSATEGSGGTFNHGATTQSIANVGVICPFFSDQ